MFSLLFCTLYPAAALALGPESTKCQPILKGTLKIADLPCAGTIKATNKLGSLTSDDALIQARTLLWRRYTEGSPCFFNLELVSKEGMRTRFVYRLSRSEKSSLVVGWSQSWEAQPGPNQKAEWSPLQETTGATVTRNESDGSLVFLKDGHTVGKL